MASMRITAAEILFREARESMGNRPSDWCHLHELIGQAHGTPDATKSGDELARRRPEFCSISNALL